MDRPELDRRVARGEDLHTELKEWPVQPDSLAAELVAFANTDGGRLLLGVSDDRRIVGVADPHAVTRFVDNVAANNCEPPVTVVQEVIDAASSATVVVVNVAKGDMRPYRTSGGPYYIRTSSGRRDASREELLRLFQATESLYYDETPVYGATTSDLDRWAIDRYLDQTGQPALRTELERVLENWGLLRGEHPTIAGVLVFAADPQRHLPFAQITAAVFDGLDVAGDPADRKDLGGRLLDVVDQAERFLDLHLRTRHEIRGFEPEPRPEIPKEALREAVVNAVAHRDYTVRGPIRLFVFRDRIELRTPGKPPNGVTEDAMRLGVHIVRNPRIYARLSDAGLVTRAGTGIPRMIRLVRQAVRREVEIALRDVEVVVTIPRPAG